MPDQLNFFSSRISNTSKITGHYGSLVAYSWQILLAAGLLSNGHLMCSGVCVCV